MKMNSILLLITLSLPSLAFTLSNEGRVRLPGPEVIIRVAANVCDNAGFSNSAELASMVEESVKEYWNRIPTCALEFEVLGVDTGINTQSDTLLDVLNKTPAGQIVVGCSDNASLFSSEGTLGVGSINTINGDRGAFLINNRDTSFANLTKQEKLATISHEIGHAFGLGHSGDPAALMYYSVGGKIQDKLSIDDYDACSYLYPHDAPGSCSAAPIAFSSRGSGGGGTRRFLWTFLVSLFLVMGLWKRFIPRY